MLCLSLTSSRVLSLLNGMHIDYEDRQYCKTYMYTRMTLERNIYKYIDTNDRFTPPCAHAQRGVMITDLKSGLIFIEWYVH